VGSQAVTVPSLNRRWAISVGEFGEFGLIARITGRLGATRTGTGEIAGDGVHLGPGDDAAVVAAPDGRVVATTDLLVEGRHFRLDWSGGYDIGRKAAAQNLADIAAMGARPTALLLGLGVPAPTPVAWIDTLADGLRDEGAVAGAAVVGGDVVRTERITVAVTALGDLEGRAPLTRSGARPGDVVAVAGRLGHAAAGEGLFRINARPEDIPEVAVSAGLREIVAAHRRPRPPYDLGPAAALLGATSMIDVSDGLAQDLGHIAAASGVRVALDSTALPRPEPLVRAAELGGLDPLALVLHGGEDHPLAGTFPDRVALPPEWTMIGRVLAGESGVLVDGKTVAANGWDHFG
jgi:thiamine-monophosphate kinase